MPEAETGAALLEVVRTLRPEFLRKRKSHRGVTSATRRFRARISPCWVFPHLFSRGLWRAGSNASGIGGIRMNRPFRRSCRYVRNSWRVVERPLSLGWSQPILFGRRGASHRVKPRPQGTADRSQHQATGALSHDLRRTPTTSRNARPPMCLTSPTDHSANPNYLRQL